MKAYNKTVLLCFMLFSSIVCSYSQVNRTWISSTNGQYKEQVDFHLSEYQITDSTVMAELNEALKISSARDSKVYLYLYLRRIDEETTKCDFYPMISPSYGEKARGYFTLNGVDVLFWSDSDPTFLRQSSIKKSFSYERRFYKYINKNGEECELDIPDEDDGDNWTVIFKNGHFFRLKEGD